MRARYLFFSLSGSGFRDWLYNNTQTEHWSVLWPSSMPNWGHDGPSTKKNETPNASTRCLTSAISNCTMSECSRCATSERPPRDICEWVSLPSLGPATTRPSSVLAGRSSKRDELKRIRCLLQRFVPWHLRKPGCHDCGSCMLNSCHRQFLIART